MKAFRLTCMVLCLLLLTATAWADDVIESGADLWRTPADGNTYYDFAKDPIPAGFFCKGSAAFDQRIVFHGVPLTTSPPDALGGIDTVIHRLDDAAFNRHGQAVTRVQPAAISLVASTPVKTSCGSFDVKISLQGEQPTTDMVIVKEGANGGYFHSSLSLNLRITFLPESSHGEKLNLTRRVDFPFSTKNSWASAPGEGGVVTKGLVSVDRDGDGVADTFIPATSNFAAGWAATTDSKQLTLQQIIELDDELRCHAGGYAGDQHCYYP
jgi:hypothetical protein